jgi:Ca2+-binding EF-hand superfamily protein
MKLFSLVCSRTGGAIMAVATEIDINASRTVFESWDLNGDGLIDPDEFHALLCALDGDVSRAECMLDFQAANTEESGYLDLKEFAVWWTN